MEDDYFGFKKINKNIKQSLVDNIFSNVADKYDLMNDIMSFGIHHYWKRVMLSKLRNTSLSLIDVASGTGDIAKLYIDKSIKDNNNPFVTICDINYEMLSIGRDKMIDRNIHNVNYISANAEEMPIKSNSFDYYTIAFGIRNVTNIEKALDSACRILKPGGKFICLEFSKPDNYIIQKFYDFYSFNVIPKIGKIITKNEDAYRYLVESIRKFPSQEKFISMMNNVGLTQAKYINLSNGIVSIFSGYKL